VIKVEVPERGDLARQLGADPDLNERLMGVSFLAQNAGKKSITLNLKKDQGQEILKRLVKTANVLVENYRPGVMDRLGVGYDVLKAANPNLIHCAISGFGQDGPMRDLPAYDQIIQGVSGVMSITGAPRTAPYRVGYPICDTVGGLTAAFAIAAALNGREKNGGAFIDVSMLEATLVTMGWIVSNWLIAGVRPEPHGNENVTSAPSGAFETADGLLNIAANEQAQWETLCRHLGRAELICNPDYKTRENRKAHRAALKADLETILAAKSAREWARELNRLGVPSGAVFEVPDILDHPQIAARGMVAEFPEVPGAGRGIRLVRTGLKVNGEAPRVDAPPPRLGEHNAEIYGALGLSEAELGEYAEEGVI
jgi:crotonobetainyl-CoA:carnitine CoA-transferase CaiB-like acyl-CoA transferase